RAGTAGADRHAGAAGDRAGGDQPADAPAPREGAAAEEALAAPARLGGDRRNVVVEAEAVVRVVATLDLAKAVEALRSVSRPQTIIRGLARVVDVAAAERPRIEHGGVVS